MGTELFKSVLGNDTSVSLFCVIALSLLVSHCTTSDVGGIEAVDSSTISESSSETDGTPDWVTDILGDQSSSSLDINNSSQEGNNSSSNEDGDSSIDERSSSDVQESSSGNETVSSSATATLSSSTVETPEEYRNRINEDMDYIFDQNEIRTYNIVISQTALDVLNEDPAAETYVTAALEFEGQIVEDIEVRYKGSVGAWHYNVGFDGYTVCLDEMTGADGAGSKVCQKLSMKIKFNTDADPERKFFELKKLQFMHMNNDPSQLRDRLGYWLFRAMGVTAPRSVNAIVQINGVDNGLYALVEQIDGRFTRANFNAGEGNLYKQIMPVSSDNAPRSDYEYITALKTNEDENPSVALIKNFAEDIQNADGSSITGVIKKWMNVNEMMAHMVVNRVVWHWDSPWTPDGYGDNANNYYWYEDPDNEKLTLIPWDLDLILHEGMYPDYTEVQTPRAGDPKPSVCNTKSLAKCSRLFMGFLEFEDEYKAAVVKLRDEVYPQFKIELEKWRDQVRVATQDLNGSLGDPQPWISDYGKKGARTENEWSAALDVVENQLDDHMQELFLFLN
ncbi:MAG: CotH kinase family protein [Reichenbachiella sp.]